MSEFKAVIFDFFDVVHKDHQKAWFTENGLTRSGDFAAASDLLDTGVITNEEYIRRFAAASGRSPERIAREFAKHAQLDHGTVQVIQDLRLRGVRTGLLSNSSTDELRPILELHKLEPHFDHITISGEVGMAKPDPAVFEYVLEQMGLLPNEAVFTDDNLHNIDAAAKVGLHAIHFTSAEQLRSDLSDIGLLTDAIAA